MEKYYKRIQFSCRTDTSDMKVSIVTISFNQARFIAQTIESVLSQDYSPLEYIIVDPGSTDGSREIIQKYRDNIGAAVFESDRGPADGLNNGFKRATGEICGFVNADDTLLPGAIRNIVKTFNAHPLADVVYGNGYVVEEDDTILRRVYADPFNLRRFAYRTVTFTQPSVFFKRSAFDCVGGFNIVNRTCWDAELLADLALAGKSFVRIDEFLSCFRLHNSSISGSGRLQTTYERDWKNIFKKICRREPAWYDPAIGVAMRIEKWIFNPLGFASHLRDWAHNTTHKVKQPRHS